MSLEYFCFISYPHTGGRLVKKVAAALRDALEDIGGLQFKTLTVSFDDGLEPGKRTLQELSRRLCHSVCLIALYIPPYEESDWCLREFEGMRALEEIRRNRPGVRLDGADDLIIPIILDKDPVLGLPRQVQRDDAPIYCDFSGGLVLLGEKIVEVPEVRTKLLQVIHHIARVRRAFAHDPELCADCGAFQIPDTVPAWRSSKPAAVEPKFPFRK